MHRSLGAEGAGEFLYFKHVNFKVEIFSNFAVTWPPDFGLTELSRLWAEIFAVSKFPDSKAKIALSYPGNYGTHRHTNSTMSYMYAYW